MSRQLDDLVMRIRDRYFAFPPANESDLVDARKRGVPESLLAFYALCDGAFVGDGDDFTDPNGRRYRLMIPQLSKLQTTQEYGYVFDDSPMYAETANWWQIVDYGDANWLALDASNPSENRIIDIDHETVGEPDCQNVIALTLADLLNQLVEHGGVFWFKDDFEPLGTV